MLLPCYTRARALRKPLFYRTMPSGPGQESADKGLQPAGTGNAFSMNASLSSPMHVAVLGAGALGSFYGALLCRAGCRVTLISTRTEHVRVVREHGLTLESSGGETLVQGLGAVENPLQVEGAVDLLLVCVKSTVTKTAIAGAAGLVGPNTMVLTLQNGLGNVEALAEVLPSGAVLAGVSYCGATFLGPGRIREAGRGETVLGELDGAQSPRLFALTGLLEEAGLKVRISNNVTGLLWTKLMANVGINALAALTGLRNGQLLEQRETVSLMERAVAEAEAVAVAKGIELETGDPRAYVRSVAEATAGNFASMVQDVMAGRPTEVGSINGAIVEQGRLLGVACPVNAMLTDLMRAKERGYLNQV